MLPACLIKDIHKDVRKLGRFERIIKNTVRRSCGFSPLAYAFDTAFEGFMKHAKLPILATLFGQKLITFQKAALARRICFFTAATGAFGFDLTPFGGPLLTGCNLFKKKTSDKKKSNICNCLVEASENMNIS